MKYFLFVIFYILQIAGLFAQKSFFIAGETNLVVNGKAVLVRTAASEFYSFEINDDTVQVHDHGFVFDGALKYPEQFRLKIMDADNVYITEPFFIDTGFQKMLVDSSGEVNTFLDFGYGVTMSDSKANTEYVSRYLPLFGTVNKKIAMVFSEIDGCDTLTDSHTKEACILHSEAERIDIRKTRDSILLDYATLHPASPILSWLLYESIWRYGYNEYYQKAFNKIDAYAPSSAISNYLKSFLNKQKLKSVGSVFPLSDFINNNMNGKSLQQNKYTLIDFWFSGCGPCIAQFGILRTVYEEHKKKGFEIVAISTDGKETVPEYKRMLKQNNYPWKQILDAEGVKARSLNIHKYPSNFLLDNKGNIVYIDINPTVLNDFLEKNL